MPSRPFGQSCAKACPLRYEADHRDTNSRYRFWFRHLEDALWMPRTTFGGAKPIIEGGGVVGRNGMHTAQALKRISVAMHPRSLEVPIEWRVAQRADPGATWLTYTEAASYTGWSVGHLRNLVSAGRIPVYGRPRVRRFRRDMLDLYLTSPDVAMREFRSERARMHGR
jgi:excisionase family DNA binding protein